MKREHILGGILGVAVGDALGVPVEFSGRDFCKANPVTDMIGFGTHNQPPGTCYDAIPKKWIEKIARKEEISLCNRLYETLYQDM